MPFPDTDQTTPPFAEWAILELLGHRHLAGWLTTQQIGGATFFRLDIPTGPADADPGMTQFYAPAAVYAITPVSRDTAWQVAQIDQPRPVERWELPRPEPAEPF